MRNTKMFLGAILLLCWISPCFAGNPQNLEQDNAQLRRRLERLENAIEELRKAAVARGGPASSSQAAPAAPAASAGTASPGEDTKNLKEENAQLKQRLEKLESALAAQGNKETNKPPSPPAEPKNATPSAKPQTSGVQAEPKSLAPSTKPQASGAQVEPKNLTASTQPQPSGAQVEPKNLAPSAKPQTSGAQAEPKNLTASTQPQPFIAPVEPKSPTPSAQPQSPSAPVDAKKTTDASKPPAAPGPVASDKKSVLSSLDIEIYGIVKADASYDSSRTNPGNYVVYVDSEATRKNDNEFNLTANQTRLGLRVGGPASETLKTSALVEVDFYGKTPSPAENKAAIQMRHAYVTLDWPKSKFSILAGQTSDIISPLTPNTLNYTVLWDAGNIGYRRPQIRLTQNVPIGEKASVKLEGGLVRTIGRLDPTGSESGEDAGFPTVQGRVSATFPFFGPKPTTVGVSGHTGQEEYDLDATGRHVNFNTWSINLDVTQPVCPWLTILGEGFYGRNLDQYFGGIGQGVNTTTLKEIDANGGWIAASLGPWSKWSFNVGAGLDNAGPDNVPNGGRTHNSSVFGNVFYAWNKNAQLGVELSQWNTQYKGPGNADDLRAQTSFLYKF